MCAQTLSSLWLHVEVLDVCELLAKTWSSLLTMSVVPEVQLLNCAIVLKCISECIHACITNHVAHQVKRSQCSMLKFRWELTHFRVSNSTVPHTQRVKSIVDDEVGKWLTLKQRVRRPIHPHITERRMFADCCGEGGHCAAGLSLDTTDTRRVTLFPHLVKLQL